MKTPDMTRPRVAIAHDYLTQRGGAERVVLAMTRAFPSSPVYTSLYEESATFPEFDRVDVRTTWLERVPHLNARHRLALPLLAPTFDHVRVDADVVVCSSSGWAHGIRTTGRKIVYCHTPARWLYDGGRYLGGRRGPAWAALSLMRPYLLDWDRRAALTATRYLANSTVVRRRIRNAYGIDAEVLPAPPALCAGDPQRAVEGLEPGYFLCVSRLLPYKNVGAVVRAFDASPHTLVVVGTGPEETRLRASAPRNVHLLGAVSDDELRWLYANCAALVAASHEDYGLTPLEAATFGKPSVVLRSGGFLDTVVDDASGIFFDRPDPTSIRGAVRECATRSWDTWALRAHGDSFSESIFCARLREIVEREAARC
jgi:glycosyltransferase involved in cell wall biosynthesis